MRLAVLTLATLLLPLVLATGPAQEDPAGDEGVNVIVGPYSPLLGTGCQAPALDAREHGAKVEGETLVFWVRVLGLDAPLQCPLFTEMPGARRWQPLFVADSGEGYVSFWPEQWGIGAQPTARVGIWIASCNPPVETRLDADVVTIRLPLQGEAYCWPWDEHLAYDLRGMTWEMSGRTQAYGRVNAPPAYNVGEYYAWDDVEPWSFTT